MGTTTMLRSSAGMPSGNASAGRSVAPTPVVTARLIIAIAMSEAGITPSSAISASRSPSIPR